MPEDIIHIHSISKIHQLSGLEKPTHPLITKIEASELKDPAQISGIRFKTSLYSVGLKDKSYGFQYGRNDYDFDEGVLYFTAPDQIQASFNYLHDMELG